MCVFLITKCITVCLIYFPSAKDPKQLQDEDSVIIAKIMETGGEVIPISTDYVYRCISLQCICEIFYTFIRYKSSKVINFSSN